MLVLGSGYRPSLTISDFHTPAEQSF